jgi:branched-chain amino acid transport system substrate-binding protein
MSEQTEPSGSTRPAGGINRRSLLRAVGAGAAAVGTGGLLQACSSGIKGASSSSTNSITIGWIHPLTG